MKLQLARLQTLLNNSGFDDARIARGIKLNQSGFDKIAKSLTVTDEEARALLGDLIRVLRRTNLRESQRYGYEKDQLGNVTIRDIHTDQSIFIRGTKALEIVRKIKNGDEQGVIAGYFRNNSLDEAASGASVDQTYASEIRSDVGSFNFPWKYSGKTGFGTASYTGHGEKFSLKLISVRDNDGEEVSVSGQMKEDLTKQAYGFIGDA